MSAAPFIDPNSTTTGGDIYTPIMGCRFIVTFYPHEGNGNDPYYTYAFTKISGIGSRKATNPVQEGGRNYSPILEIGPAKEIKELTFERGLQLFLEAGASGEDASTKKTKILEGPATGFIAVYDMDGTIKAQYKFVSRGAVNWQLSTLDSMRAEPIIETYTIAHMGLERVQLRRATGAAFMAARDVENSIVAQETARITAVKNAQSADKDWRDKTAVYNAADAKAKEKEAEADKLKKQAENAEKRWKDVRGIPGLEQIARKEMEELQRKERQAREDAIKLRTEANTKGAAVATAATTAEGTRRQAYGLNADGTRYIPSGS